ncbi:unnamed protein product [Phytomonas sp. Hart1]|nr:unnamed protein product [Phytomonas sp. Hart1]|eukprot:CCW69040.1 unnamed protein product [Phytomonas sp. isolate Hart1]
MFRRLAVVPFFSCMRRSWSGCITQHQALHHSPALLSPSDVSKDLADDLYKIINNHRVVLFITGTPEEPRCRFTVRLIDIVHQIGLEYVYFDILQDDEVCEGLKTYSDWPTYPQVYIDGVLLGGYDVVKQMMLDGSLVKTLSEKKLL